ncbi:hypothetical protein [Actinomycetospora chibensis]|uniref:Uncharacterized protein n=1 Tax=Actinomycetospora chibensis TaxID=663606 RepID=A0ABV9RS08_9PSEU|nr:hypothetical protein [Actinomycetospora chibensis]MDD7926963.1 hypothetical protein [Actinomycetospora chibensis]
MSTPFSPRVVKGALVGLDLFSPLTSVIVFQYNPETVTRTLQGQASGDGGARSEATRLKGPPIETIKIDVEIDRLAEESGVGDPDLGIYPQLAALEMLLYPASALAVANTKALATGTIEVMPPVGPFTLLVWGPKRVLPVRLTEFSITEELHDADLNPLRAKVSLGLRVLSYTDLSITHPGYYVFLSHQIVKEALAKVGSGINLAAVIGADVKVI